MNLHEYQGKSILKSFGVAIQEGIVIDKPEDAVSAAEKLNKEPVCSTIEACRLELAPKPSLPESPIVALKDSSNKVMISIIIIVIILITIISGYVMLKN